MVTYNFKGIELHMDDDIKATIDILYPKTDLDMVIMMYLSIDYDMSEEENATFLSEKQILQSVYEGVASDLENLR